MSGFARQMVDAAARTGALMDLSPILVFAIALIRPSLLVLATPLFGGTFAPRGAEDRPGAGARCVHGAGDRRAAHHRAGHVPDGRAARGADRLRAWRWPCACCRRAPNSAATSPASRWGCRMPRSSTRRAASATTSWPRCTARSRCMVFLLTNAHHEVLRALATSYEALPHRRSAASTRTLADAGRPHVRPDVHARRAAGRAGRDHAAAGRSGARRDGARGADAEPDGDRRAGPPAGRLDGAGADDPRAARHPLARLPAGAHRSAPARPRRFAEPWPNDRTETTHSEAAQATRPSAARSPAVATSTTRSSSARR